MSSDFVLGTISVCVCVRLQGNVLYISFSLISALELYAPGLIRIYQFQYGTTTPCFTEQLLQRRVYEHIDT